MNTPRALARKTLVQGTQDPAEIKKRSVVISGHRTSISLENVFWESLRDIASANGQSVNQLVTEIDRQRTGNLSSAIRTYVLLDAVSD
ncbi:MAG TPA: aryl-sulfate sulfotransferase [Rhodospirillaceae bacterium]|nr:aryl-sulfate sulfotransferase [Rhodospirillaceae bacterium]MAX64026.1 aryl-sulfate sulfotransferase [Rhodospirillaceae bacterium]MBB58961.1 aryl-sulfate sulfotransferase [Rhodospirillaceae bacterium]HAE04086.1 aryl-sulfate sulfotransferase [Rhodospirillaceae bacterium]HAJ19844.1 aryl-sulfate sulfotransferase [Rhodospirillaceae bacterium]